MPIAQQPSPILEPRSVSTLLPVDLPAPPISVVRVLEACSSGRADARELASVIGTDPVMTAEVLRIANSAYFGIANEVRSVRHAISLVGQRTLRNFVLCVAVREALKPAAQDNFDSRAFWNSALRRAVATRHLAAANQFDPDEGFTLGLLLDIGLLALVRTQQIGADAWSRVLAAAPDERLMIEEEIFGITHDQAGVVLAEAWSLPTDVAEIIGGHHQTELESNSMMAAACCADWIASVFDAEVPKPRIFRLRALVAECFGGTQADADELIVTVGQTVGDAARALGIEVQPGPVPENLLADATDDDQATTGELHWRLQRALDQRDELAEGLRCDVERAKIIQRSLLPTPAVAKFMGNTKQWPFFGINVPGKELSGDFFDYFPLHDGRYYFAVADVSGKGLDAALLMTKAASLFHCLGKFIHDPIQLVELLNTELYEMSVEDMFVTMVCGLYDPEQQTVLLANAGHPPPLLFTSDGDIEVIPTKTPPLGVLRKLQPVVTEHHLRDGAMYLFSDGLVETEECNGDRLGYEGVIDLVRCVDEQPKDKRLMHLMTALTQQCALAEDDITMLLVEP